jgi:hypothetical protein
VPPPTDPHTVPSLEEAYAGPTHVMNGSGRSDGDTER